MSAQDLVPFQDHSLIDQAADPATFVVAACERAKAWLTQVIERGDIDSIVEIKSAAEAIRVYTIQKQLGMDSELAAAEIVRRAERGIGVAIRRGQEAGELRSQGQQTGPRKGYEQVRNGRTVSYGPHVGGDTTNIGSPADYLPEHHERSDVYRMTDGVTDEQFEEVIEAAKTEKNLSRANVVRKVKSQQAEPGVPAIQRLDELRSLAAEGHRSAQIAEKLGVTEEYVRRLSRTNGITLADEMIGKVRRVDPNRVVETTVTTLDGLATGLNLIWEDFDRLDRSQVEWWVTSLSNSIPVLNRLKKQLKEMTQ